ncbi:MAG: hypothetical protein JKY96_08890 [Phycisphaerales bacterium]|nr:hypothetical protein [Phycisphaerales bacterium]
MPRSNTVCALALLSVLPTVALGGLTNMEVYLGVETESSIDIQASSFIDREYDESAFERVLTPLFGFDSVATASHDTMVEHNGQSAHNTNITTLNTDANGFVFGATMNSTAERGSGFQSYASTDSTFDLLMVFDADTVLDIFLRIDYRDIGNADLAAEFSLSGLQGAPLDQIGVENPQSDGFVELAFQATVLAGETFTLGGGGFIILSTGDHGDSLSSGDLALTAIVRVVPAPGGLAVFGGFGLLAARRRRGVVNQQGMGACSC